MTVRDRLRQLASALPSDTSAVTLSRADIVAHLEEESAHTALPRDLTVEEVAGETGRAASTVRGWLISGALRGYKLNGRDSRPALLTFLTAQTTARTDDDDVDISDWRSMRGT